MVANDYSAYVGHMIQGMSLRNLTSGLPSKVYSYGIPYTYSSVQPAVTASSVRTATIHG